MSWKNNRTRVAIALWGAVLVLLGPAALHLYSQSAPESEILLCYPESNPDFSQADFESDFPAYEEQLRSSLAEAADPNAQLMLILVGSQGKADESDIAALAELNQRYPGNGLIAAQLIKACTHDVTNPNCSDSVIAVIAGNHGDNGAIWGAIALLNQLRENESGVRAALRAAIEAPEYDDYFSTQLAVLDTAAPQNDPVSRAFTYSYLFNFTDYTIGSFANNQSHSEFCTEHAPGDAVLTELCLSYGERLATASHSQMGSSLGYGLQTTTHWAIGNEAEAQRISRASRLQRDEFDFEQSRAAMSLLTYDGELARFWIDSLIENGEIETRELLLAEARQRSANPDYQPCDQPGLRFEFPYFYFGDERVVW